MDTNIPIDIQCNKLVDWLIDRRHCNIRWIEATEIIKAKIINALKDMPGTPEMRDLVQGSCFHYYKCKQIVELLKDTEKDTKNIFGRYSSQRMKDWLEINKLYESENVFLAELASRFIRNLNYEIPSVKRQINKCQLVQDDTLAKEKDIDRNIKDVKRKYAQQCKKMGIIGDNVKMELLQLVGSLPKEFNDIAENIKKLSSAIEFYFAFANFTLGEIDALKGKICPMLMYVIANGNTTVYQYQTGNIPEDIIKDSHENKAQAQDSGDIDWGESEIDFGTLSVEADFVVEESGQTVEAENGFEIVDSVQPSNKDVISWDIEEISIEDVPNGSNKTDNTKVAIGEAALTILEYISTRNMIINELLELKGFLLQRISESNLEADFLSVSQFQFAPHIVQMQTVEDLYKMSSLVDAVHLSLTSSRMRDLCKILDSPNYVDRLFENLKQQLNLVEKYIEKKVQCENLRTGAAMDAKNLKPVLQKLINETKEWKSLIEAAISKFYKNRQINLVGTINTL